MQSSGSVKTEILEEGGYFKSSTRAVPMARLTKSESVPRERISALLLIAVLLRKSAFKHKQHNLFWMNLPLDEPLREIGSG
jgi:hypothetical protein